MCNFCLTFQINVLSLSFPDHYVHLFWIAHANVSRMAADFSCLAQNFWRVSRHSNWWKSRWSGYDKEHVHLEWFTLILSICIVLLLPPLSCFRKVLFDWQTCLVRLSLSTLSNVAFSQKKDCFKWIRPCCHLPCCHLPCHLPCCHLG